MQKVSNRTRTTSKLAAFVAILAITFAPVTGLGAADPVTDAQQAARDAGGSAGALQRDARAAACEVEDVESVFCAAAEAWSATYDGPGNNIDRAFASGISPDGALLFVTGQSRGESTNNDYATIAYETLTGSEAWSARYDGPANGYDTADALVVSPDGLTVFVTGWSTGVGTRGDATTVAYEALTGDELWTARYDGPASGQDAGTALAVSPDGSTVYMSGYGSVAGNDDYLTIAYDAATGNEKWVAHHDGSANDYDRVVDMGISPDGAIVYVTGTSISASAYADFGTVAYDAATGNALWVVRYDSGSGGLDSASAMGVSTDGSTVIVTGLSNKGGFDYDYATVAYDAASGDQSWATRYDGLQANGFASPRALVVSPDSSRVYVTGMSLGPASSDAVTIAYDVATGLESWISQHDSSGNIDQANAMAVSPDGATLYVTGQGLASWTLGLDAFTVAYDAATGEEAWSTLYAAPGRSHDVARTIEVNPLGTSIYIAGNTAGQGRGNSYDYLTMKYDVLANPTALIPE